MLLSGNKPQPTTEKHIKQDNPVPSEDSKRKDETTKQTHSFLHLSLPNLDEQSMFTWKNQKQIGTRQR